MLVAGAAVSLIAPLAAQASDVNIDGMNDYSRSKKSTQRFDSKTFINEVNEDLAILNGRIDGLEAQANNFEAGSFSDTTTLDSKVIFTLGAADFTGTGANTSDATKAEGVAATYTYQGNLNTSFTGDDNLYIRLKTGNAGGWMAEKDEGGYLSSTNGNSDAILVDKIWYTFPVGESNTFWVGPKIENYYMHATTPSIYSPTTKQFALGGNAAAYGASTNAGAGWAYNAENGFAVSSNVVSQQNYHATKNSSPDGFLANGSKTSWATQVGYTQPQYAVSAILNLKYNGWYDEYFSTLKGYNRSSNSATGNSSNIGLRGWWRPAESGTATPSISFGYDTSEIDGATAGNDSTDMWFAGLNWFDMFQADDKIGAAIGQPQTNENDTVDPLSWEAYYAFKANDSTEHRATVFGGTDRNGTAGDDITGVVFQTTFKF